MERGEAQPAHWHHMSPSEVMMDPACHALTSEIKYFVEQTPIGALYYTLLSSIKVRKMFDHS